MFSATFLCGLILFTCVASQGQIDLLPPNFPAGFDTVSEKPGPFFKDFKPPFPTNKWWNGFTVNGWQNNYVAGPFPFQSRTMNFGFEFGIATLRYFNNVTMHVTPVAEVSASFVGLPNNINNRKATGWDSQTISLQYFNGGTTMDVFLVPGSPYITLRYTSAQVVITASKETISSFSWVVKGSKAKFVLSSGQVTYLLYVVEGSPVDFKYEGNKLTSTTTFTGVLRFAKLISTPQETVLDKYAANYPTGVTMTYSVTGNSAKQIFTWKVVGDPDNLLMLCWPHHRRALQNPKMESVEYLTLKGRMMGVRGSIWTLNYALSNMVWFPDYLPHSSCQAELIKILDFDVKALKAKDYVPTDFYFWGGMFAKTAQMALVAERIGRKDLIPKILDILKGSIQNFLEPGHTPEAVYETAWGGVINKQGPNSRLYNDHHFVFGYFIHGAAIIGKYDPDWLQKNKQFFNHMAADYANPSSNSSYYPFARHFDFFAGHSWASGIGDGAGARNQESTTEAINAYYALSLYALVTNNPAVVNWARLLLAIEIKGAQTYWHMYPNVTDPYPEPELRKLVTIGNLYDASAGAWTHFKPGYKIQTAAIQILPLSPMGLVTYDSQWISQVLPYCQKEIDGLTSKESNDWTSVIYPAYANYDAQKAYVLSKEILYWGTGNSATNSLYFIASRSSAKPICEGVFHTPEGVFLIQDMATGKYITTLHNGLLTASVTSPIIPTRFKLALAPGGGTVLALWSNLYVKAFPEGTTSLSAASIEPKLYELFRWKEISAGIFEFKAVVNQGRIETKSNGELVNSGSTKSTYRVVPSAIDTSVIPAAGRLKNVATNRYVVAMSRLLASQSMALTATTFNFEKVTSAGGSSPVYTIRHSVTRSYVGAEPSGNVPLVANKPQAKTWEWFEILRDGEAYVIVSRSNGLAVAVQNDQILLNNAGSVTNEARWIIE